MKTTIEVRDEATSRERARAANTTIMLAESCNEVRSSIRSFLEASGYRVVEAVNGFEAVEAARRERLSLILMDLNLPLLDGYAALYRIRKQVGLGDIPSVAISAYTSPEIRTDVSAAGFSGFILITADAYTLRQTRVDLQLLRNIVDRILCKTNRV